MADEAATAKDKRFKLVSLLPDVCKTPGKKGKPIPYPIVHTMDQSAHCSPNVFFRGQPAYLHNESYVDKVKGDEAGGGKGIVSRTHVEISHNIDKSGSVFVNGKPIVRTGDMMWMNWKKPDGGDEEAAAEAKKAQTKAERWQCRQQQIAAAKAKLGDMPPGAERDKLAAATERFERNNRAVEQARLAQNVYHPEKGAPEGWKNVSNDPEKLAQYGLKPKDLEKPGSEFRVQVYEPDPAVFGNDMKPQVVFKGTVPSSMEDWKNNVAQGADMSSTYYENAVGVGKSLKEFGADVEIVGHSLGGGMASAASRVSGLPATTFNSSGLHPNTVTHYGGTPIIPNPENIQAFRVENEILDGVQTQGVKSTLGAAGVGALIGGLPGALIGALGKIALAAKMPDAVGIVRELPGKGLDPIDRHDMRQVIEGIEGQKTEDQAVLAKQTGVQCG